MDNCVETAFQAHHERMNAPNSLRFTVKGPFSVSKPYRRIVKETARAALDALPTNERARWPAQVVELSIDSVGTSCSHKAARRFANMLHGVIYRKASTVRGIGYREDDLGPRVEVTVSLVL